MYKGTCTYISLWVVAVATSLPQTTGPVGRGLLLLDPKYKACLFRNCMKLLEATGQHLRVPEKPNKKLYKCQLLKWRRYPSNAKCSNNLWWAKLKSLGASFHISTQKGPWKGGGSKVSVWTPVFFEVWHSLDKRGYLTSKSACMFGFSFLLSGIKWSVRYPGSLV